MQLMWTVTILFTSSEKVRASPGPHSTGSPRQEIISMQGKSIEGQAGGEGGTILSESLGPKVWVMQSSLSHSLNHFLTSPMFLTWVSTPAVWPWASHFASVSHFPEL